MRRIMVSAALLVAALAATTGVALAVEAPYSDAECVLCHGADSSIIGVRKVDFSAEPVDYIECRTCHYGSSTGQPTPYEPVLPDWAPEFADGAPHLHSGAIYDCGDCHAEYQQWGYPFFTFVPRAFAAPGPTLATTPYGFFLTADSIVDPDLGELHTAHAGDRPIEQVLGGYENWNTLCAGCHGVASCDSCHALPAHEGHGGTTSCSDAGCHPSTAASVIPSCLSCHPQASDVYHGKTHTAVTSSGCANCHSLELAAEHARHGLGCNACHDGGYVGVVASWDKTCDACHTSRHSNRTTSPGPGGGSGGGSGGGRR